MGKVKPPVDCKKCQGWKNCTGKSWFSYGEVKWCSWQILWIIEHLEEMKEGIWPDNPNGSASIDKSIRSGYQHEGNYVKAAIVSGEVEARVNCDKIMRELGWRQRLGKTDLTWMLLVSEVQNGSPNLNPEAHSMLVYLSGGNRKTDSFTQWRAKKNWKDRRKSDIKCRF